jgi:hypothetical protein
VAKIFLIAILCRPWAVAPEPCLAHAATPEQTAGSIPKFYPFGMRYRQQVVNQITTEEQVPTAAAYPLDSTPDLVEVHPDLSWVPFVGDQLCYRFMSIIR